MSLFILIIAFFVIVTFVIGVAFLFGGYSALPNASAVAPAGELLKAQTDLKSANNKKEELRAQANALAVELQGMKDKLNWAQENVNALEETLKSGEQAQTRLEQLEKDLSFLSQKADSQALEAIDVITRLSEETQSLQKALSQAAVSQDVTEISKLTDENQKFTIQIEGYTKKVKELESAVAASQEASNKLDEINKASVQLTQENLTLRNNLALLNEDIKSLHEEGEKLKKAHEQKILELQEKILKLEEQSKNLVQIPDVAVISESEQELKRIRLENEERIVQANAALVKLNSQMELFTFQINEKDARIKKLVEELLVSRQEVESSRQEIIQLKDLEKEFFQEQLNQLQHANQLLRDKEKILLYKLAQSRAQAMGLERFSEGVTS